MGNLLKIGILTLCVVATFGCKRLTDSFGSGGREVLAEVDGEKLLLRNVTSIFTPGMTPEDSLKLLHSYVDRWVKKELKVAEAERLFKKSQQDIDRMVDEYRNTLLTRKVDQYYIDHSLDTLFTDRQIAEYYREHRPEFVLDKTMLKARVVRLPRSYSQKKKIRDLMAASGDESRQDLAGLCVKNGLVLTELNQWSDLTALLGLLPIDRSDEHEGLLSTGEVHEYETKNYIYFAKVTDLRRGGDNIPLESAVDMIRRMLFNQRKEQIVNGFEDSLYREAESQGKIKIHVK